MSKTTSIIDLDEIRYKSARFFDFTVMILPASLREDRKLQIHSLHSNKLGAVAISF
jgi:hypothetical protein